MMGHREKLKTGDEYDRLTKGGHRLFLSRAGKARAIKSRFSRRIRREARQQMREEAAC